MLFIYIFCHLDAIYSHFYYLNIFGTSMLLAVLFKFFCTLLDVFVASTLFIYIFRHLNAIYSHFASPRR